MSNFTASDVLLKAASRIEEEGMWCKGRFFEDSEIDGPSSAFALAATRKERVPECAMGALLSATIDLGLTFEEYRQAESMLESEVHDRFGAWISEWNDRIATTAGEVADLMRFAVAKADD